jgi:hypothetical protein
MMNQKSRHFFSELFVMLIFFATPIQVAQLFPDGQGFAFSPGKSSSTYCDPLKVAGHFPSCRGLHLTYLS